MDRSALCPCLCSVQPKDLVSHSLNSEYNWDVANRGMVFRPFILEVAMHTFKEPPRRAHRLVVCTLLRKGLSPVRGLRREEKTLVPSAPLLQDRGSRPASASLRGERRTRAEAEGAALRRREGSGRRERGKAKQAKAKPRGQGRRPAEEAALLQRPAAAARRRGLASQEREARRRFRACGSSGERRESPRAPCAAPPPLGLKGRLRG